MTSADRGHNGELPAGSGAQRLDKWLWFARIVKSRTLAATLISAGKFRVNKVKVERPSQTIKPGDVVTSSVHRTVRIFEVKAPGARRGPAAEAACLYSDLTPPPPPPSVPSGGKSGARDAGTGRPTKRDRRLLDRLQGRE